MKKQVLYLVFLIALAVVSRLIAPWPNFTAMIAVAVTGGMLFGKRTIAILLPLLALFVSDLIINNTLYAYLGNTWLTEGAGWLYASYLLITLLGTLQLTKSKVLHLALSGVAGSILFFLITNFGAWLGSPFYPQSFAGLLESYVMGLPFLFNQVVGSLFYIGVIIGLQHLSQGSGILSKVRV